MFDKKRVEELFKQCIPIFTVLADENRRKLVELLAEKKEGYNVSMIAEHIPLSRPAISHHLKILKQAGMVDFESRGTENYYFLTLKDTLGKIKQFVSIVEENYDLR